jgi:hypothetical protein
MRGDRTRYAHGGGFPPPRSLTGLAAITDEEVVRWLFDSVAVAEEAKELIWSAFADSSLAKYRSALKY